MTYDEGKTLSEMLHFSKIHLAETFDQKPQEFHVKEGATHLTSRVLITEACKMLMHVFNNVNHQMEIYDLTLDMANALTQFMSLSKDFIVKYEISEEDKERAVILINRITDYNKKIQQKTG